MNNKSVTNCTCVAFKKWICIFKHFVTWPLLCVTQLLYLGQIALSTLDISLFILEERSLVCCSSCEFFYLFPIKRLFFFFYPIQGSKDKGCCCVVKNCIEAKFTFDILTLMLIQLI